MKRLVLAAAIGATPLLIGLPAKAQTIDAPNTPVAGQSIADWTAGWWGWLMPFQYGATPLDDTTGALANTNNNGPVFYVAGTSGGTANRTFTVPAGRPLLIPVLNQAFIQYPVPIENQLAGYFYGGTLSLNATIDGIPVSNLSSYAETSPVVDYGDALPGSYGQASLTPGFTGDPACPSFDPNDLCPSMSVGYWLMVNLPAGEHVISTSGSEDYTVPPGAPYGLSGTYAWSTGTTITVDVIPEPASALLLLPAFFGISWFRKRLTGHGACRS
jgi:hypothetical protein